MMLRLILILFVFLTFSCNEKVSNEDLSIFRYNESAGISSLDPAFSKDQANIWAVNQIFDGLVQLDDSLNVSPSIAKEWSISDDGLSYRFYLRNDVYFHNHKLFKSKKDRRVTAKDFEYSFNRLLDPETASPGVWVLSNVNSYEAINDTIFEINLQQPFPPFLGLLSMPYCFVVPERIIENNQFLKNPIGTGPFKFQYWKRNVKLVFRKNNEYFEKGLPFLDAVAITFIKDKQTAFLEFLKGKIDFISGIDASYKDEVLTKDGKLKTFYEDKLNFYTQPYLNTEYLGFLMDDDSPNSINISIRKAINYGFDRKKMIRYLRNNIGTPAEFGFIPMGLPSFTSKIKGYNYQPDLAKKLIADANLPSDHKIILSTTSSYLDICEFIQGEMKEHGLSLEISINPPSTHRQMVATSKLSFFRGSWIADYADAENYLALFYSKNHCPNGPNYTHFSNKEFDDLYELAVKENSLIVRQELYQKMDQLILDNAPIVPLYYDKVLRFVQKDVSGLQANAMNSLKLKYVQKLN